MPRALRVLIWISVALLGATAVSVVALRRGEAINAVWLVTAALCCYALGYRFYRRVVHIPERHFNELAGCPAFWHSNTRDHVPWYACADHEHFMEAFAG